MAYSDIALLAGDSDFIQRCRACALTEGELDPVTWVNDHAWQLASTPTFGDKYAYAIASGVPRPGNDPAVISDADILASLQPMLGS